VIGVASGYRVILEVAEAPSKSDVLGLADLLIAQEQDLVAEQRMPDRSEQVVIRDSLGKAHPDEFCTDVRRELFDAHQITKIDEPVVLPASMSLCA
jgi:hypothetical protein